MLPKCVYTAEVEAPTSAASRRVVSDSCSAIRRAPASTRAVAISGSATRGLTLDILSCQCYLTMLYNTVTETIEPQGGTMHDVVIVGSRCAGAPLAMLLARNGHDVLVVDRATFPSDTMSTHFIQPAGMTRLIKWGLADRMWATGCPPVTTARLSVGTGEDLNVPIPLETGVPGLAAPRRFVLDKILVDAAVEAGAQLREGVSVDGLLRDR